MFDRTTQFGLFALYQSSLAIGLLLLPIAVLVRQAGFTLPVGRLVERTERAYRSAN
jgi:hypothetical protein